MRHAFVYKQRLGRQSQLPQNNAKDSSMHATIATTTLNEFTSKSVQHGRGMHSSRPHNLVTSPVSHFETYQLRVISLIAEDYVCVSLAFQHPCRRPTHGLGGPAR
jgi:hypothetical protein